MRPENQSCCNEKQPLWKHVVMVMIMVGCFVLGLYVLMQSIEQEEKVNDLREKSWNKTITGELRYRARVAAGGS